MHAINENRVVEFFKTDDGRLQARMETDKLYMRTVVPEDGERVEDQEQIQRLWDQRSEKQDPFSAYLVFKKAGDTCLGRVEFARTKSVGEVAIGIVSEQDFWIQGYAKEVLEAIIWDFIPATNREGYMLLSVPVTHLSVKALPANRICCKVYEKIGFRLTDMVNNGGLEKCFYEIEVPKSSLVRSNNC